METLRTLTLPVWEWAVGLFQAREKTAEKPLKELTLQFPDGERAVLTADELVDIS